MKTVARDQARFTIRESSKQEAKDSDVEWFKRKSCLRKKGICGVGSRVSLQPRKFGEPVRRKDCGQ